MEEALSSTIFPVIVTKVVDLLRNSFDREAKVRKWVWNALALVLGVVVAFLCGVNVVSDLAGSSTPTWLGRALTGLGIGALGSGWHELLDVFSSLAKATRPKT